MLVRITPDNHIQGSERLVGEVEEAVRAALGRFEPQIMRVEVHLADENSHKQGDSDKRCTLEARLAGLQPVAVSDNGSTINQAVSGALDKLGALLDRKLGRLGERKGRGSYGGEAETPNP